MGRDSGFAMTVIWGIVYGMLFVAAWSFVIGIIKLGLAKDDADKRKEAIQGVFSSLILTATSFIVFIISVFVINIVARIFVNINFTSEVVVFLTTTTIAILVPSLILSTIRLITERSKKASKKQVQELKQQAKDLINGSHNP